MGSRKELCATVYPDEAPPAEVASTLAERVEWDVDRLVEEFPVGRYAEQSYEGESTVGEPWPVQYREEGWPTFDDRPTVEQRGEAVVCYDILYNWTEHDAWEDVLAALGVGDGDLLVVRTYEAGLHGWGTLYRWRDGHYAVVDRFEGAEGEYGEDVVAHFRDHHGVEGHLFRQWDLE
jgi:hypothetical protein